MQSKEQKITIEGVTFSVAPFMVTEALRLKMHLVRTFGPAIGEILGGINGANLKSINDLNLGGSGITKGVEKLLEQLDEESFVALIKRLFANVTATLKEDGKAIAATFGGDFEVAMQIVFQGRIFSIYELIVFVLKVNYPDFFDKVVSGIGRRIQKTLTSVTPEATLKNESETSETLDS